MTWYAIRITPGAFRDARIIRYHRGPRDGLKTVRTAIDGWSAIEMEFQERQISYYLPVEHEEIIHHRTKQPIQKRKPLLPGYVFIKSPKDWFSLHSIRGVIGVMGSCGVPIIVPEPDIDALRRAEEQNRLHIERVRLARYAKKAKPRKIKGLDQLAALLNQASPLANISEAA